MEGLASTSYLELGEREVNDLEEVIAASAPRLYDELIHLPIDCEVSQFLDGSPCAVVVFDGLSLREMPMLSRLAAEGGFSIVRSGVGRAALPSETVDFVDQRLGCGRTAPSQLPGRRELKERGVVSYYFGHPGERHAINERAEKLLLWSSFPDNTYSDSGARFADHFGQIASLLQPAWNATVMAVPRGRRVLVTSDHGYVFLGAGLSFHRHREDLRILSDYLGGERYARLSSSGPPPEHADLAVYREKDLAVLKGRIHLHPPGKAASRLYKHGGLSLMEMLTPWMELVR